MSDNGWIGVDLDGTLANYEGWKGIEHIGAPIEPMRQRVLKWLVEGQEVKIFTARVSRSGEEGDRARAYIERWCLVHLGVILPVTNIKDWAMIELWDDRAVQVVINTGERADGK
jgi:hypothetical protein